eukprot:scaffold57235_cov58-Attheya_sp.AAC.7
MKHEYHCQVQNWKTLHLIRGSYFNFNTWNSILVYSDVNNDKFQKEILKASPQPLHEQATNNSLAHTTGHPSSQPSTYTCRTGPECFISASNGFHPHWHPQLRSDRFPSMKKRLKVYMSNWYTPSRSKDDLVHFQFKKDVKSGKMKMKLYPPSWLSFVDSLGWEFCQQAWIPFFSKVRYATDAHELALTVNASMAASDCNSVVDRGREEDEASISSHYVPIVWLFGYNRHFGFLNDISKNDTPWHKKKPFAVWRGAPTGRHFNTFKRTDPLSLRCPFLQRCNLVSKYCDSAFVNVGLSFELDIEFPIPDKSLIKRQMELKDQLH